jgi:hypothetical protein
MPVVTRGQQRSLELQKTFHDELMATLVALRDDGQQFGFSRRRVELFSELFEKLNCELPFIFFMNKSKYLKLVAALFLRSLFLKAEIREKMRTMPELADVGSVFLDDLLIFHTFAEAAIMEYYYLDAYNVHVAEAMGIFGIASLDDPIAVEDPVRTAKRRVSDEHGPPTSRMCTRSMKSVQVEAEAQPDPEPDAEPDNDDVPFPIETSANAHVTVRRSKRLQMKA